MTGFIQDIRYALRALGARRASPRCRSSRSRSASARRRSCIRSSTASCCGRCRFADPDRVMLAREISTGARQHRLAELRRLRRAQTSFEQLAAWRGLTSNLTGIDRPRRLHARHVTWDLLSTLGVRPVARPRLHRRRRSTGARARRSSATASGSASSAAPPRDRPSDHARRGAGHRHRRAARRIHDRAAGGRRSCRSATSSMPQPDVPRARQSLRARGDRPAQALGDASNRRTPRSAAIARAARTGVSDDQQRQQRDRAAAVRGARQRPRGRCCTCCSAP